MTFAAGLVPDTTIRDGIISKIQKMHQINSRWSSLYGVVNGSAAADSFNKPDIYFTGLRQCFLFFFEIDNIPTVRLV
jgi:hypothetical protein